jgi:hypothetical protein
MWVLAFAVSVLVSATAFAGEADRRAASGDEATETCVAAARVADEAGIEAR